MRIMVLMLGVSVANTFAGVANAQTPVRPDLPGSNAPIVTRAPDTTGNDRNIVIAPGPTGASTIQTDSAAGGNAGQPSRAVPQGSGGGGSR